MFILSKKGNIAVIGSIIIGAVLLATLYALNFNGLTGFAVFGDNTSTDCGFTVDEDSTLAGNITECSGTGIFIGAPNVTLDCRGYSIIGTGMEAGIDTSGFANVTIKNCTLINFTYGVLISVSDAVNLSSNTAHNNSYGFFVEGSNSTMYSNVLYGNSKDLFISRIGFASIRIIMQNTSFLNPSGTFENYTILNLNDTVYRSYSISWSTNTSSLPTGRISVGNRYVQIANESGGGVYVTKITWVLPISELSGYNASRIELGYYDGFGWGIHDANPTNDSSNFYFNESYIGQSLYAILQINGTSSCGEYVNSDDLLFNNLSSCSGTGVFINASNITFDCQGYPINGIGIGAGINISNLYNVTIYNCILSNFTYGMLINASDAVVLYNNGIHNNSYGLFVESSNSTMSQNYLYDNSKDLFVSNLFAAASSIYADTFYFFPPSGDYENYTILNLNDTVNPSEQYSISWSANTSSLPAGRTSVRNKYVQIINETGAMALDNVDFNIPEPDPRFEIWDYNGSIWTKILSELGSYVLSTFNLNQKGVYGVFYLNGTSSCGQYVNSDDFLFNDLSSCSGTGIFIKASNITFDCIGYSITLTGDNSIGINITGLENVTLKNCKININYTTVNDTGIWVESSDSINLINSTVTSNFGCFLTACLSPNLFANGIYLSYSNASLSGVTAFGGYAGIYTESSNVDIRNGSTFRNIYGLFSQNSSINSSNSFFDNSNLSGLYLNNSNLISVSDEYKNNLSNSSYNAKDLIVSNFLASSTSLNITNGTFLFGAADIRDSVEPNTSYSIARSGAIAPLIDTWIPFSSPIPTTNFLKITSILGSISVGSITLFWKDSQLGNFNENNFALWGLNGAFALLINRSPDTTNNLLGISGSSISTGTSWVYEIMSNQTCNVKNSDYQLTGNVDCYGNAFVVGASGITIDCAGHSISGHFKTVPIGGDAGIYGESSYTNITVKNCRIANFSLGIELNGLNATIFNNTVSSSETGFNVSGANSVVANNTAANDTTGFSVSGANSIILNNTATIGTTGFSVSGANSAVVNNTASGSQLGFLIGGNVTLDSNIAASSSGGALFSISGSNSTIVNNIALNGYTPYHVDYPSTCIAAFRIQGTMSSSIVMNNTVGINCKGLIVDNLINSIFTGNRAYGSRHGSFGAIEIGGNNNTISNNLAFNNPTTRGFSIGVTNSTLYNNTAYNNSYGFDFSGSSDSNFSNNFAFNTTYGFYLPNSNNSYLFNNTAYKNQQGFTLSGFNNTLIKNYAYNNTQYGFLSGSFGNNFSSNLAFNNIVGFYLFNSNNSYMFNNTAYKNPLSYYLSGSYNNTLDTNLAFNSTSAVALLNSLGNNLLNNLAYRSILGFNVTNSTGSYLFNNTAYNNSNSFYLEGAANNTLDSNTAFNSSSGFRIFNSSGNFLLGNLGYNNSLYGFFSQLGSNNLSNNFAFNNTIYGFYLNNSNSSYLFNNTAYNNSGSYNLERSGNNTLANNFAFSSVNGFRLFNSSGNSLLNNLGYNNSFGFFILNATGNYLFNNSAYNNSNSGFNIINSNTTLLRNIVFSNMLDVLVNSTSSFLLNMTNMSFLNPIGTSYNYTVLSILDTVASGNIYSVSWASNSTAVPISHLSFANKFVNISNLSGAVSIDSLNWSWNDSELTGYSENKFEIWKYNGSWTRLSSSPDTVNNLLSIASLSPASIYGILQNNNLPPGITLNRTGNNEHVNNTNNVTLNFTAIDDFNLTLGCSLYINGNLNQTNGSVQNNTLTNFNLNVTLGIYSWFVNCTDGTMSNVSETRAFSVNDTILPAIYFTSPTDNSGYFLNRSYALANATATDANLASINISIYDYAGALIASSINAASPLFANFSGLFQGIYYFNATAYDLGGNSNSTETRNVTIDTTVPPVSFSPPTDVSGSVVNRSFILVNVSSSDINLLNITIRLYNSSNSLINSTAIGTSPYFVNFTNLADGQYYFNATAYDLAGNQNSTETRNVSIDKVIPVINFVPPTDISGTLVNRSYALANVTATDANLANITVFLYNSSNTLVNSSTGTTSPLFANFSGLFQGIYYFNATAYDLGGNSNSTETRNVTIDTLLPALAVQSPINTNYTTTLIDLNYTASDINLDKCWYTNVTGNTLPLSSCNNVSFTALQGVNSITVYANDSANNINSSQISFFVDSLPPGIQNIVVTAITNESAVIVWETTEDANGTVEYGLTDALGSSVDETNFLSFHNALLSGLLNFTLYYYNITACDVYGNCNISALGPLNFTTGQTPHLNEAPVVFLVSPEDSGQLNNTDSTNLSFVALDDLNTSLSCDLYVDGAFNQTNSSVQGGSITSFIVNVNLGNIYNWVVNCTDGEFSNVSETRAFAVNDIIYPVLTVQSPINATWYNTTSIKLNYTALDSNLDKCWYTNITGQNETLAGCTNITFTAFQGPNNITVYVNDTSNNINSTTIYFYVDTVYPALAVQSPSNANYTTTSIDLNYTASDINLDKCWYTNVTGNTLPLAGCINVTFTALQGANNITVYANDSANNINHSQVFFFVDSILPSVTIISPAALVYNHTDILVNISASDSKGVSSVWFDWNGTNLPYLGLVVVVFPDNSTITLTAYANDTSGNIGSATVVFSTNSSLSHIPLAIFSVGSTPSNESALVSWNTNLNANSTIDYGISTAFGSRVESASLVLTRSLTIPGLENNTLYYYNVTSCNLAECVTAGPYSFTTLQNSHITPPAKGGGGGGRPVDVPPYIARQPEKPSAVIPAKAGIVNVSKPEAPEVQPPVLPIQEKPLEIKANYWPWIIIAILAVIFIIILAARKKEKKTDIRKYVKSARKTGLTDEEIRKKLLNKGWPEKTMEEALKK